MTPPRTINPWLILGLVCLPVFIGALDLTIVSAFLPEIIVKLQLPVDMVIKDASWVVTGYLLAYTISMTFMGRVSDLIGRRSVYIACLLIFVAGSIIVAEVDPDARRGVAGLIFNILYRLQGERPDSGSVALLTVIIGRVVQALGAGALVPVSLALVGDLFPPERRGQPLGVIGAIDTMGWVLGHLYGGIMVNFFNERSADFTNLLSQMRLDWTAPDWRTLFWINAPIALIVMALVWWMLRGVRQERAQGRFDILGTLLLGGSIVSLIVGMGSNLEISASAAGFKDISGLPPYAGPVLLAAGLMFAGFLLVESRLRDPLFDLRIFRRRNLSAGSLTNLFVGFCLMSGLVSVPILVNIRLADADNLAAAALQVGLLLSTLTVPMALAAVPGGWLSERLGYRRTTSIGLALALVGFLLVWRTWTLDVQDGLVAVEMALVGIGLGLTFSPISAAVINAADKDKLGVSSALVIILRLLGMTISVSALTTIGSQRLAVLVSAQIGSTGVDPTQATQIYVQSTVQVLSEIGLLGAVVCGMGLIPALMLRGRGREMPASLPEEKSVATSTGD